MRRNGHVEAVRKVSETAYHAFVPADDCRHLACSPHGRKYGEVSFVAATFNIFSRISNRYYPITSKKERGP
ncbi:MAG TPA: hypothetical protein DEB39_01325 [Planctomycetaceae bacterium]|nr:hypothetical protein [Planctomycetaceae bacterium]